MKCFLVIAAVAGALWSAPTKVSIEAAANTFISAQEPDRNFATADKLESAGSNERITLLRFDLSKVPATAFVSSANLVLTFDVPKDQLYDSKFTVCDLSKDFSETEATYRQAAPKELWVAPGLERFRDYGTSSLYYCSDPIRLRGPGPASSDISRYVRNAIYTHRKTVNLAIFSSPDSSHAGSIHSRRSGDPNKRPRLEILINPTAPKAVTNHPFLETKFAPVILDASESSKPDGTKTGLQFVWTVARPAPASTYSPGQELGREIKLKFEPDVPGVWDLRLRVTDVATKEFSETEVTVTDIQLAAHPRLGLNADLLNQIKGLKSAKNPVWTRFEEWLKKPGDTGYGYQGEGLLLAYVVTKDRAYFNAAWKLYTGAIYANGKERSAGLRPFVGSCDKAVYCDEHSAAFIGGFLITQVATLYDWGFDAMTPSQRQDLIDWLNAANDFNFNHNSNTHTHFRNDGIIITAGLAASAYATYGENRVAMLQMAWFRQEWEHTLLALDVTGKGGASGEGNAYGEATAGFLINLANAVFYASGENLFYSHPFFRRHLAYTAFSTYPNRLHEADDPLGHSDPPRPVAEGSVVGGDDSRGDTWHSAHLRPNGLILARRFPNSEEAAVFNWVFRQKDNDQSQDPFVDVLYYGPPPALVKPKRLSFFDPSMGYVYLRSDWNSRDATWISSWAGPHVDLHAHLDQGAFTLFKRRDLAIKSGSYDFNPTKPHFLSYYTRTVSANDILVGDPNEFFSTFIGYWGCDGLKQHDLFVTPDGTGKVCIPNDGGQRTMAPYSLSLFSTEEFFSHRAIYETAKVVSFADNGQAAAWVADITNAYTNPAHAALPNKPKVNKVYRKFVYLREPDILLIADTVDTTSPDFEKSWLIHGVDRIEVGGTTKVIDHGETVHSGTDRARIVVDDKQPSTQREITADLRTGYAALQIKTLFPDRFQYRLIGGREPAPVAHQEQFQPDPKKLEGSGQGAHLHTHFKDFWVKDYSEGVQPDHRSLNWAPVYPQESYNLSVLPTFIGGYGRWRLEMQPTVASNNNYFLNILKPTLDTTDDMPETTKFETAETFGATVTYRGKTQKVTFSKETLEPPVVDGMDLQAPVLTNPKPLAQLPGGTKQTIVSLTTNEPSSCRFSFRPGITFPYMTNNLQSADGLTHITRNAELNNGDTYTYYVRCADKSGNENLEDLRITFSVAH